MSWGEQFPWRMRERLNVSTRGSLFPPLTLAQRVTLSLTNQAGDPRGPRDQHLLLHLSSGRPWRAPDCPISPPASLREDPTPNDGKECIPAITFLFPNSFCNKYHLINHVLLSYPKLVLVTYLCQIFIWREFLLIANIHVKYGDKKGCCHLMSREKRVSQKKILTSSVHTPGLTNIAFLGHSER